MLIKFRQSEDVIVLFQFKIASRRTPERVVNVKQVERGGSHAGDLNAKNVYNADRFPYGGKLLVTFKVALIKNRDRSVWSTVFANNAVTASGGGGGGTVFFAKRS